MTTGKAYKGLAMEGRIATWYAANTGRDRRRFAETADAVAGDVALGATILEVAPGPGYLAVELARRGYCVSAVDISRSFVDIARANAKQAGVAVDIRHGNAAALPFGAASFEFVVCTAAFKNFTDPVGALNDMHRVLKPGARASIYDLRKDASPEAIEREVRSMRLSRVNALVTRGIFRFGLLRRAYTAEALRQIAGESAFGRCEIRANGIGLELRLAKE
jgi:ubiquinone/menaquinone biosynthesis C-methylase UbiE